MEVIIRPNAEKAADLVVAIIEQLLRQKPHATLGLATGRTMEMVYKILTTKHTHHDLDFSKCSTFNLDEYIGLAADDPGSYRYYMNQHLFNHININIENTFLPDGVAEDIDAECKHYEEMIDEKDRIDLQLLGIGSTGHIGFNEPLSALLSRTRAKALTPDTLKQNAPMFGGDPDKVPKRAITMGVGTILESRRCILLATGTAKAEIVAEAVEGPVTSMISATALQLHPHCTVIIDEEAAAELQNKDYYHWVFRNEPEWQEFQ